MKKKILDCAIELPNKAYMNMKDPEFQFQTPANDDGDFMTVYKYEGKYYKFKMNLFA